MPFITQFNSLDSDNSGHLTTDDLAELAEQVNERARDAAGKIGSSSLDKLSKTAAEKRVGKSSPVFLSTSSLFGDSPPAAEPPAKLGRLTTELTSRTRQLREASFGELEELHDVCRIDWHLSALACAAQVGWEARVATRPSLPLCPLCATQVEHVLCQVQCDAQAKVDAREAGQRHGARQVFQAQAADHFDLGQRAAGGGRFSPKQERIPRRG